MILHHWVRRRLLLAAAGLSVALVLPSIAASQQTSGDSSVAAAATLRDRGDYAGAVAQLRPHVALHPEDADAARLLAETLYWMKEVQSARDVYEGALARHPHDESLRLAYGRMLRETGDGARARAVLAPLLERSRGRAETQLGTLAYWEGDLSTASNLFIRALRADSTLRDARRQLREIAGMTAPWVSAQADAAHDDQPLDRLGGTMEGGWFPTPSATLRARAGMQRYRADSSELRVASAEVGATHFAARARVESEAAGGLVQRGVGGATDWTGRIGIGFRLTRLLAVRARAQRDPYFFTLASLTTPVTTRTGTAMLALTDGGGWLGEVAAQRQWFPDTNAVNTAYAWLLAPLIRGDAGSLLVGYGATAQSADHSRYVLANPTQPYAVTDPRFRADGRYAPYYTPSNVLAQSVLGAVTLIPAPSLTLRLNGSYGVSARESAPAFQVIPASGPRPASLVRTTGTRSFAPWTARGAIEIGSPSGLQAALIADALRTAFYTSATAGLRVSYHFTGAALSRADRY